MASSLLLSTRYLRSTGRKLFVPAAVSSGHLEHSLCRPFQQASCRTLLGSSKGESTSEIITTTDLGLESIGIKSNVNVYRNLTYEDLAVHEKEGNENFPSQNDLLRYSFEI